MKIREKENHIPLHSVKFGIPFKMKFNEVTGYFMRIRCDGENVQSIAERLGFSNEKIATVNLETGELVLMTHDLPVNVVSTDLEVKLYS